MTTINVLKEQEVPGTPLFLFDCTLPTGEVQHWSTHNITRNGNQYLSRVLKHNIFDLNSSPENATDGVSTVSITLANADSFLSPIELNVGWKGSSLAVTFLFFDLTNQVVASDSQVVFRGIANPPDQSTESTLRLSFTNTLNLQRVFLPEVRIQKLCPWNFPATAAQRQEAVTGGTQGAFSPFYRCGYSPDQTGGVGNMNAGVPYTTCDYSRAQCQQRGMFATDAQSNVTRDLAALNSCLHQLSCVLMARKHRNYPRRCPIKHFITTSSRLSTEQDGISRRLYLPETMGISRISRYCSEWGRLAASLR